MLAKSADDTKLRGLANTQKKGGWKKGRRVGKNRIKFNRKKYKVRHLDKKNSRNINRIGKISLAQEKYIWKGLGYTSRLQTQDIAIVCCNCKEGQWHSEEHRVQFIRSNNSWSIVFKASLEKIYWNGESTGNQVLHGIRTLACRSKGKKETW